MEMQPHYSKTAEIDRSYITKYLKSLDEIPVRKASLVPNRAF